MTIAVKLGSRAIDSDDVIVNLRSSANANQYSVLNDKDGNNYQVPTGKILIITQIIFSSATASCAIEISYGDTAVTASGTPPTNNKTMLARIYIPSADEYAELGVYLQIPAGKYPHFWTLVAGTYINITGFLIDE